MYAVDDIAAAVAAVRAAGGQAGDVERQPNGLSARCRDDQGLPFWLGQLS
jgi:predicted enzyme related to lactoylglutathione lyase